MDHLDLLTRLARPADGKVVLLVIDGVGDIRTAEQPRTALEVAKTPNLDDLAAKSALGRLTPVVPGVTPGSGPGHLGLFGYDPTTPEADIGRGVLEALGLGLEVGHGDVAARGNFATADADGNLTDRRAGRIPTEECRRLCEAIAPAIADVRGVQVQIVPGENHRFVLIFRGAGLSAGISDTDPQKLGVPPLDPQGTEPSSGGMATAVRRVIERMVEVIQDEPQANRVLLRGFSKRPHLRSYTEMYKLTAGAFAGYPLYRGVAAACGMEVVPCGKSFSEIVARTAERWDDFDYFFLHVKQTDAAGEDGDLDKKVAVLEEVDGVLPELLALGPRAIAITGDHSTPCPMKAHSWHPIPLLVHSDICFIDECTEFTETAAVRGHLGTMPSHELMGVLLANAGRLAKYGA